MFYVADHRGWGLLPLVQDVRHVHRAPLDLPQDDGNSPSWRTPSPCACFNGDKKKAAPIRWYSCGTHVLLMWYHWNLVKSSIWPFGFDMGKPQKFGQSSESARSFAFIYCIPLFSQARKQDLFANLTIPWAERSSCRTSGLVSNIQIHLLSSRLCDRKPSWIWSPELAEWVSPRSSSCGSAG